jgi:hypothetical protein
MKTKNKVLPMAMLSLMSFGAYASQSLFAPDGIQLGVRGAFSLVANFPSDGSDCDPNVIRSNLFAVNDSGVFRGLALTGTQTSGGGSCYGPCPEDVQAAIKLHCEKGELLAHLVKHLEKREK